VLRCARESLRQSIDARPRTLRREEIKAAKTAKREISTMIKIKEIAYTGYPVTDVARAQKFYEGVLGLEPAVRFEHEGKHWIEYNIGPATLAISNMSDGQWKPSPDGPSVALEVEDFDGAVAALREAKVKFALEPMDSGVCRMAFVFDPDGNALALHQRKTN
jgi:predicted enzyme related to lactoylglutathione lyase